MQFNFDEIIDRHNTNAIKVDRCKRLFGTENIIPLWVADMDFRTPDFILDAIEKRLTHPILGYTDIPAEFIPSYIKWMADHHQWHLQPEWIGFVPGVVTGITFAIQSLTEIGDEIIVQPPVYYPFIHVVNKNDRKLVYNQLKVSQEGKFEMDFNDLENKITPKTRMLIMSNPHNPGGKVWNKETLEKLAEICSKNQIIVISDEIHADMTINGNKHIPFATVSKNAAEISVTLTAPTKTFNIPGLLSSSYIIINEIIRAKYTRFAEQIEVTSGNIFAYVATLAAYQKGEEWRKQMLDYVVGNINYVVDFLDKNIPQIKPMIPEASYLVWLNCRGLGFAKTDEINRFFVEKAGLGLNIGTVFGPGGEQHMRLNVGCSRKVLEKAMSQLKNAVEQLNK